VRPVVVCCWAGADPLTMGSDAQSKVDLQPGEVDVTREKMNVSIYIINIYIYIFNK
jgi:hypothetical protein